MVDVDWQLVFHRAITEVLPQCDSSHNPLLISCSNFKSQHSKNFHFQAVWISDSDYVKLVDNIWNAYGPTETAKIS